jgi:DNA-binding transcriptional ArsR family regulator
MTDSGSTDDDRTRVPPSDVFGILGNETRMDIIRALAEAESDGYEHEGHSPQLSFSELREAVGIRDSGQFNYHLEKLVGRFVRETEAGYALTYLGVLLYRTVLAGFFDTSVELHPFETPSDCHDCGATLEASYSSGVLGIECPDCGREYMSAEFPPSGVRQWEESELLTAFDQYLRHQIQLLNSDTCIWCAGPMPGTVETKTKDDLTGDRDSAVYVVRQCEHCNGYMITTPGETVLYHPAVVSFFYERGVDVTSEWLWDLPFVVSPDASEVRSEEPLEVAVTVTRGGASRTLVLDERADVIAVEE